MNVSITAWLTLSALWTTAWAEEVKPAGEDTAPSARLARLAAALGGDDSFKVRLQAAIMMGRMEAEAAVEPLVAALQGDPHYTVRGAAATALANLGQPQGVAPVVRSIAQDPDKFVVAEATRALDKFERERIIPHVMAVYNGSDDSRVRRVAVEYLSRGDLRPAQSIIIRALGDVTPIRNLAQKTILEQKPAVAMRILSKATKHVHAGVRRGAVEVLHALGTEDATMAILAVYQRDLEVDEVRSRAKVALRELRKHLPVPKIVADAKTHDERYERARALKLLGVLGGAEAETVLLETLKSDDRYLRGTAVMALGDLGNPAVIPELEKLLNDPNNQSFTTILKHTLKQLAAKRKR